MHQNWEKKVRISRSGSDMIVLYSKTGEDDFINISEKEVESRKLKQ